MTEENKSEAIEKDNEQVDLDAAITAAMNPKEDEPTEAVEPEPEEEAETEVESEEEAEPEQEQEEKEPEETDKEQDEKPEPEAKSEDLSPPEHWDTDAREAFAKIDNPKAKELVLEIGKKLQAGYTRRNQELAKDRQEFEEAFAPVNYEMTQAGISPAQLTRNFISWHNALKSGGVNALLKLGQEYGISLDDDVNIQTDPNTTAINNRLSKIEQQFTNQQITKQQAFSAIENEIAADVTNYPLFEEVQPDMVRLLRGKTAQTPDEFRTLLDSAYKQAIRLNPSYLESQVASQVEKRVKERLSQEKQVKQESLEKAKKAQKKLSGSGPAKMPPQPVKTVDDALALAMKQLGGKV